MQNSMSILRSKLNQLEVANLRSAQSGDEIFQCPISDDAKYTKKFYSTMKFLHHNYPQTYRKVTKQFHLMSLSKGLQTLKACRTKLKKKSGKKHTDLAVSIDKQVIDPLKKAPEQLVRFDTSGGMYQVDFIRFMVVRFIINEFRLRLHVPMSKEDIAIEMIKDLNLDDNGIIEAGNDYNYCGYDSDDTCDLYRENGDDNLDYARSICLPMIDRLQDLMNSKHDWFNITKIKYSFDDDDEDYSIHFKPIANDSDKPKYSQRFNNFKAQLNQVKISDYDVNDLDKLRNLYNKINDLFNTLTGSSGDMCWGY